MNEQLTDQDLLRSIEVGVPFEIRGYNLTGKFQNNLERVLSLLLESYNQSDRLAVIYTVVQELALWASLANMRQIFFQDHGLDLADTDEVHRSEPRFQTSLTFDSVLKYRRKIKQQGLYLQVRIEHSLAGMRVEVTNNAIHSPPLEEKLREQLRRAMRYESIMDYFKDNPEDNDGRGIGLAFSLLMLKEAGLRPELLRLGQTADVLVSRIEIPFDSSFKSIREAILNDEEILPFKPFHVQSSPKVSTTICAVCGQLVDERVYFGDIQTGMINENRVSQIRPGWKMEDGACASCIAVYS